MIIKIAKKFHFLLEIELIPELQSVYDPSLRSYTWVTRLLYYFWRVDFHFRIVLLDTWSVSVSTHLGFVVCHLYVLHTVLQNQQRCKILGGQVALLLASNTTESRINCYFFELNIGYCATTFLSFTYYTAYIWIFRVNWYYWEHLG